jgi:hypothetical protein
MGYRLETLAGVHTERSGVDRGSERQRDECGQYRLDRDSAVGYLHDRA